MALIKDNARVAAQIAVELEKLQNNGRGGEMKFSRKTLYNDAKRTATKPLIIGGSILDVHYRVQEETLEVSEFYEFSISVP